MGFSTYYTRHRSSKALKAIRAQVSSIVDLSPSLTSVPQEVLIDRFRALSKLPLDQRKVEAFAIVREACFRSLGLLPFEVQLIGGLVLLDGKVAEMATGEGKTLSIVAPAAVLALDGKGVHVVTANSYLAERDAKLMRPAYEYLGLSVAHVSDKQSVQEKQAAYACDVVYGVGHEFGFDYLKDNIAKESSGKVQRGLHAAIVDEVDSILIDEARVPLIISKQGPDYAAGVIALDRAVSQLSPDKHYDADLKERNVSLTEDGYAFLEAELANTGFIEQGTLYSPQNLMWVRRLHSAVKAHVLFKRDRDYVIEDGELVLVDTGSGRKMPGRRFEDGLHEALEAREGLKILPGTMTAATVTYQNFFGLYAHIGGLTGTALTDAEEFTEIYQMEVVVIPPNKPRQRQHLPDTVYLTKYDKFKGAVQEIQARNALGQPVLVGCATIRDAEVVSVLLNQAGVVHNVLTAKHLEHEAHIIANAGVSHAVTVATNMAGRGTDIALGGEKPEKSHFEDEDSYFKALTNWREEESKVLSLGGLHVLGTERNGLRRVDNQLAGRCGRQGNVGSVHFVLSLEDELLKIFGQSSGLKLLRKGMAGAGSALSGSQVSKMVTSAQVKVENQGFDARKQLMKFDGVLAVQRKILYEVRDTVLSAGPSDFITSSIHAAVHQVLGNHLQEFAEPEQYARPLKAELLERLGLDLPVEDWLLVDELSFTDVEDRVLEAAVKRQLEQNLSVESASGLILQTVDDLWAEHLTILDELKHSANLKAHSGKNPLYEFTKEGYQLFDSLMESIRLTVAEAIMNPDIRQQAQDKADAKVKEAEAVKKVASVYRERWILRNEACPCGSGTRYKDCHGKSIL